MKPSSKQIDLANLSPAELDERAAASVSQYGVGTKSYNASAEKREMARQTAAVTAKYESSERKEIVIGPICNCLSFPLPHELRKHNSLQKECDWRPWQQRYVLNETYNCYELKRRQA